MLPVIYTSVKRHPDALQFAFSIPFSLERVVCTVQVDGWTRVAIVDKDLNKVLHQYGNVSPAKSPLGWYAPPDILIAINNVYMRSPALSRELDGKLADARQYVLKTQLKDVPFDIWYFGRAQPCLDQISTQLFQTALFKVLVCMVQTYIRVKIDHQDKVVIDGQEVDCCLSNVAVESNGWRIKARRCVDNLELDVMVRWEAVDRLPCFAFDDSNFDGHKPVPTWKWFSRGEVLHGLAPNELIGHADNGTMEHPEATGREVVPLAGGGTDWELVALVGDGTDWELVTWAESGEPGEERSEGAAELLDEKVGGRGFP
jgi:hypothetical protein